MWHSSTFNTDPFIMSVPIFGNWFSLWTLWAQGAHTSASRYETELCTSAQELGECPGNKLGNYFSWENTLCSQYQESPWRKFKLINFAPLDALLLQSFTYRELTVPIFVEPQADFLSSNRCWNQKITALHSWTPFKKPSISHVLSQGHQKYLAFKFKLN